MEGQKSAKLLLRRATSGAVVVVGTDGAVGEVFSPDLDAEYARNWGPPSHRMHDDRLTESNNFVMLPPSPTGVSYGAASHPLNDVGEHSHPSGNHHPPSPLVKTLSVRLKKKDEQLATTEGRLQELHDYQLKQPVWRIYRGMCQFRFGYFSFLVMMMLVMFSFTFLMEIFFAIFLPSAKYDDNYYLRAACFLVTLPVVVFVLSYLFEESTRLFLDSIDKKEGSLPKFRLSLAVVIHYVRHRSEFTAMETDDAREEPATGEARRRKASTFPSVLLSETDDPFNDTVMEKKDEEDEAKMRELQKIADATAKAEALKEAARMAHPERSEASERARRRWKRAKAAVKSILLLAKVQDHGPPIDLSTFLIVDFICPVVFEVVTLLPTLVTFATSLSLTKSFEIYIEAGFWCCGVYLAIWIVTHFWSSRNAKMRILVSNYRRNRRFIQRAMMKLERNQRSESLWLLDVGFRFHHHIHKTVFEPVTTCCKKKNKERRHSLEEGMMPVVTEGTNPMIVAERETMHQRLTTAKSKWHDRNPWNSLSYGVRAIILLVLIIASALVSLESFLVGWPLMGVCLIGLSIVIQRRFPQIFGSMFRSFVTSFVVMSLVFFSSTFLIGTFVTGSDLDLGTYTNTSTTRDIVPLTDSAVYPVCSIDYGGMSMLDFALIADAAYGSTTELHKSLLGNRFNGTDLGDWKYVTRNNVSSDDQVWFELYFESVNMTVIAVRGTASAQDALEDMHFWFGITIMQVVNIIVPFLRQLPRDFVARFLSMSMLTSIMPSPIYQNLLDHAAAVKARVGGNLVITGHSLGGAMAAMVGAKTQSRAVSFSGPGLLYSRDRFGLNDREIKDYVLTIKPRKDIVPRVDELGGLVQDIRCKRSTLMGCHSTFTHICELYLSCGDHLKRNWFNQTECIEYNELADPAETE